MESTPCVPLKQSCSSRSTGYVDGLWSSPVGRGSCARVQCNRVCGSHACGKDFPEAICQTDITNDEMHSRGAPDERLCNTFVQAKQLFMNPRIWSWVFGFSNSYSSQPKPGVSLLQENVRVEGGAGENQGFGQAKKRKRHPASSVPKTSSEVQKLQALVAQLQSNLCRLQVEHQ